MSAEPAPQRCSCRQDPGALTPSDESTAAAEADADVSAARGEHEALPRLDQATALHPLVQDERALREAVDAIVAGSGPVAIDAERASGYRFGQRAYLVQLHRHGAGTWLIDPVAFDDLTPLADAVSDLEWVLHAATQDIPCLLEIGLRPQRLFDTELGARLLGLPRVGLASVVERYLGVTLAKEHSAVDWSTRPLPQPWLTYAALDVEVLVQVRDLVDADLRAAGKDEWARQEFDHLTRFTGPAARTDPWRRTSGMHRVRNRRTAAAVRELWSARQEIARTRDTSPGRILADVHLVELASQIGDPGRSRDTLATHRALRRHRSVWSDAMERARALGDGDLPPVALPHVGPPPPRVWAERDPAAAERLLCVRAGLQDAATLHQVPVENIASPDIVRRLTWRPPSPDAVEEALRAEGCRPWQVELTAPLLTRALVRHP